MMNAPKPTGDRRDPGPAFDFRLMSIWLVDARDDCRQRLADSINAEEGVFCARLYPSAASVLMALKHVPAPDVILMKMEMPKMSGIEAVGPILKLAPQACVVMMGSFYSQSQFEKALKKGASGFLMKDITGREIIKAIKIFRHGVFCASF
jgi:DNA-binding NarL/FixJ family response regulator